MKTKYVCRSLISLYVFIIIGQCGQQIYMLKFAGGGKEKEPKIRLINRFVNSSYPCYSKEYFATG